MKLTNIPTKLWEHKKKSAFGFFMAYFIGRKIYRWKRDYDIRAVYARQAKRFGDEPMAADAPLRRVTVLVDVASAGAFDNFKKNALPLLNLAGLQVDLIRPSDRSEFETIAEHIDRAECDALYVVGGDSALSAALSAIYRQKDSSPVPIGVFPGGSENRSLNGLVPNVFALQNDIRSQCESAMALIEERSRAVYLSSVKLENSESTEGEAKKPLYGVAGLNAGWFDRVETNKAKLWYWGRLKRWVAYVTATIRSLKQYPEMELNMLCEEYCTGCNRCRSAASTSEVSNWRWWQYIIGSPSRTTLNAKPRIDYSKINNESCGKVREVNMNAVDIALDNVQDQDACGVRIRTGGAGCSRIGLLEDGWRRCQTKQLTISPDSGFYQNDFIVKKAILTFNILPDAFRKMTVFGNDYQLDDNSKTKIVLESTNKFVNMYLPSKIRVQ